MKLDENRFGENRAKFFFIFMDVRNYKMCKGDLRISEF